MAGKRQGITLRDRFAMAALGKVIAFDRSRGMIRKASESARLAYQYADAMLRIRRVKR